MAKIKKQKTKTNAADQPASAQPPQSAVESAVHANAPRHDVRANDPAGHGEGSYGDWGASEHVGGHDHDDAWGDPGTSGDGDAWGEPARSTAADDWGPPSGDDWGVPAAADDAWGAPASPQSANTGYATKKSSMKKSRARSHSRESGHQPPPPAQAPAPTSLHPSAAAHMAPSHYGAHHASQGWGAAAHSDWGEPSAWGAPPPPPKPPSAAPSAKPAWASWANEAKGMSMAQAQQSQNSGRDSRAPPQQSHQPSQQWQDPQFLAEQHSIYRSIQETRPHNPPYRARQGHPQPVQQADSWGYMGGGGGWGDRASTIPEEDEYDEEEDDWGDGGGGGGHGWGAGDTGNTRVRFSPDVSYASSPRQSPNTGPGQPMSTSQQWHGPQHNQHQLWTPPGAASRTMKMATGQISTTVFELAPPRNGLGELSFIDSHGTAIRAAERAMYNRNRPAKERFRWGFNPDKDPRVGTLLRWIASTSNGLATIGLQKFLETRERGALFFNADYRVPSPTPGAPPQPAYDWVTIDRIQRTLDAILQESVALYDPAFQVIVFVFLLSPSGNSMALWRRKLNVPDSLRDENRDEILAVKAELKDYPVYVDEDRLPVKPEVATPKKKVRFAFLRRLFGGKKSAAVS
ncbi:hypothetical protein BD414DRAFT_473304 [Trametes punicea]|nr:hypothetical protein BD414DRAFT_473304 [Trametes punicea]